MRVSKGIVKELEKQLDEWKVIVEQERIMRLEAESEAKKWADKSCTADERCDQLESQLEAYQSNDNPQMVSKLNEALGWKDEEIWTLNRACKRADDERDEAMQYAQEMKEKYEQVIKEAKEYEMEYEARYLNIKGQLDAMVKAYNLQREFTE